MRNITAVVSAGFLLLGLVLVDGVARADPVDLSDKKGVVDPADLKKSDPPPPKVQKTEPPPPRVQKTEPPPPSPTATGAVRD